MRAWTYIPLIVASLLGCAPDDIAVYRGDDGRSGDYGRAGLSALDQIAWKHRISSPVVAPPIAAHGNIYVAGTSGAVVALKQTSGEVVWTLDLGEEIHGAPVAMANRVIVGTDEGLRGIGVDGALQWSHASSAVTAAPLVHDAVAYVGTLGGDVLAVDAVGGSRVWTARTAGAISADAVLFEGAVVVGSRDGRVYGLDPASGEAAWTWDSGAPVRGVAVAGGQLYVAAGTKLAALTGEGGSKWEFDLGDVVTTPPTIADSVFVGTGAGDLVGLEPGTGKQIVRRQLSAPVRGAIAAANGLTYVPVTTAGCEAVSEGEVKWSFVTDGEISGVLPHGSSVFVTDRAGSVYALQ